MEKIVTALKAQKENKHRVNLYLDDEFAFGLSLNVALTLKNGQVLTETEIEQLKREDAHQQAYQQALNYLSARARSQQEISQYLQEKGIAPEEVTATLAQLKQDNYLDDEAFARDWVENRNRFRPRSSSVLRQELRQKGIEAEIIDLVLADLDEQFGAWSALEPKLRQWQKLDERSFQSKATAFLHRRGFGYTTARRTCERAWRAMHEPAEEEEDE